MRYSIQQKILLSLSVVAFIGLSALLLTVYRITEHNNSSIINKDMIEARKRLDIYLQQYSLIHGAELTASFLNNESDLVARELSTQMGGEVAIYDLSGNLLSTSALFITPFSGDDLDKAISGATAYTVRKSGGKALASLSYPIPGGSSNKETPAPIGILRYNADYTELYRSDLSFEMVISLFAACIFVFILLTSFAISGQIAKPVRLLARSTEQIASGRYDYPVNVRSRDEIGDLAVRFNQMALRIKEQIAIIEEERDALREAQESSKIFFDNVTHELKTPLTTILGYAQVMKDNGFTDREFFEKGTSYIINESQRMNRMVIEILEIAKATSRSLSSRFEPFPLTELVRDTCAEMGVRAKKYSIGIACTAQEAVTLYGDRDSIKKVLVNLIDNSIKYGQVHSIIRVSLMKDEDGIQLRVKDEGGGIPANHLEHVFEPFYRVSQREAREKGSAGLGLSIVKQIVEAHGGQVQIESKPGEGTEVLIRLGGETVA